MVTYVAAVLREARRSIVRGHPLAYLSRERSKVEEALTTLGFEVVAKGPRWAPALMARRRCAVCRALLPTWPSCSQV
ncbi:MAG: hypothetical protein DRJ69_04665 [Thermoprotei archaeon]|nr:MAG: hypothetical protein DRJ69_04665 [Thermoprotei archaeon]